MAANTTFAIGPAGNISAFQGAGGQYGVAYTDPVDVIVATHEPMWDVSEDGWFHDASGSRIRRPMGSHNQNSLDPSATSTRNAFNALTTSIAASSSGYDFVEVDNVAWDLGSAWWRFNNWGTEIATNSSYTSAMQGLLGSAMLPTIFNGLHNNAGGLAISGDTAYLPYSSGGMSENCAQDAIGPMHDSAWQFSENTMLYTTQHSKWAICEGESTTGSTDNRADRKYFLASWWLTYDPTYSVAFPAFASTGSVYVFPEFKIVPTQPIQTASASVADLRTPTGAYARQFAKCYNNGVYFGGCAAIVNPSGSSSVGMPSLASSYHHVLSISTANTYNGGTISWSTSIPSSIAPKTAYILSQ